MNESDLDNIIILTLRIGIIVAVVFNAAMALIILRQITIMNSAIKLMYGGLMSIIMLIFLLACFFVLFYIVVN